MNTSLLSFFKEEIFGLDDDEIETFLDKFQVDSICDSTNKNLEALALLDKSYSYDDAWRLGRILGAYEKASIDQYIVAKIITTDLAMKEVYFNFLAGYWDEAEANLNSAKSLVEFVAGVLPSDEWPLELATLSIEPIAVVYGNHKSSLMRDSKFMDSFSVITNYITTHNIESPAVELLRKISE
ncbi:hypothetical protein [Spartinivicinus poritis]|uniref:Transcriptional regulator n=1 Tax=Spartinivicinus poritis TaxID=2994640 RepID=A0ABT5U6N7_9GAMM|nr:hypothetical protein [Spartinivicinus sp. A2-2]MDE1462024.1 hypothetical protein [Spartinivicinus sp. A2-2]